MIQTLQSLSQSSPVPMGAPSRGPSKTPEGGFALMLQTAPSQLAEETATPNGASKSTPIAPGVGLASLLRGAAQVVQGHAKAIDNGISEVDIPKDLGGTTLGEPGLPGTATEVSPACVADATIAPATIAGGSPTLHISEGLTSDAAFGDRLTPSADQGQTAEIAMSLDGSQQGESAPNATKHGDDDGTLKDTHLDMQVNATSAETSAIIPPTLIQTQGATLSTSVAAAVDGAKSSEAAPQPAPMPQTDTSGGSDITAMPAATSAETEQGTGEGMDQNTDQNAGQPSSKPSDHQTSDASKLAAAAESPVPVPTSVTATGAMQAMSGAQIDMTQQTATSPAGPVLDMQDPQWTQDLGLIADEIMRIGAGELELKLNPEKLGAMTLRIDMIDGRASVTIITETPEAAKLMMENQFRLSEQMQRSGFDLSQTISHTATSGGSDGQSSRRDGPSGAQGHGHGEDQHNSLPDTDETRPMSRSGVDLVA